MSDRRARRAVMGRELKQVIAAKRKAVEARSRTRKAKLAKLAAKASA